MYFFVMLDEIREVFDALMGINMIIVIAILIVALVWAFFKFMDFDDKWEPFVRFFTHKITIITFAISFCLASCGFVVKTMIPSTKQAAIIYIAPKVINNEHMKEIPENILKFVNQYLKENIGEEFDKLRDKIQDPNIIKKNIKEE